MSSHAILTNTGRSKEAAALANATALDIAEIAWGDGDYSPSGGETALVNETGRKAVQSTGVDPGSPNVAFFDVLLTEEEGPFTIREAGLFDVDGDLIAIAKYDPAIPKPVDTVSALLRLMVVFSDLENMVVQIDATNAFVPAERQVNAGTGLTGGGDLSTDRTFSLDLTVLRDMQILNGFLGS